MELRCESSVCRPGKIGYKQGNKWESAGSWGCGPALE